MATSLAVPAGLAGLMASPEAVAATTGGPVLDIAEWSFFWVGVERATLPRRATSPVVNGKQMYVEYQIPAKVQHPYPIVLVHGGGGQGLDWMGTPDGRRGWATMLLEEGYKVYVVDRPGHGRSPYHPDLHGGWPGAQTLESISGLFTPQRANAPAGARRTSADSAIQPTRSCTISGREPARSARPSWPSWSPRKAGRSATAWA